MALPLAARILYRSPRMQDEREDLQPTGVSSIRNISGPQEPRISSPLEGRWRSETMSEAIKDRAKDFVAEAVEKTKGAVNDGLDAARDKFDTAADGVDARVHRVAGDVRQRAERASEVAREKYRVA